jgi:hypothetical protein
MEADISIWRKTGHFYFALTRIRTNPRNAMVQHCVLDRTAQGFLFGFPTNRELRN